MTYNQEVKAIIEENGGKVIYSSGNIIVATNITKELAKQLALQRDYIETFTHLPLRPFNENYGTIDLSQAIHIQSEQEQQGSGTLNSDTNVGGV